MTYAKRVDNNQKEIVKRLRKLKNLSVAIASRVGFGFPDIVVGYNSRNYLVEIKSENGILDKDQIIFRNDWKGQIATCYSFWHVLSSINYLEWQSIFGCNDIEAVNDMLSSIRTLKTYLMDACERVETKVNPKALFLSVIDTGDHKTLTLSVHIAAADLEKIGNITGYQSTYINVVFLTKE